MGWLLWLCCAALSFYGIETLRAAWRRKYLGYAVAGALPLTAAVLAVNHASWWCVLAGIVVVLAQPLVLPMIFGDPPDTPGPLRFTDDETGAGYRVIEDPETGETRREYET